MSVRVMSLVWDHSPYFGGTLLVLLALADWADDAGYCWPKIAAIARKARLTERQVHNILSQLTTDNMISVERGGGRGKSNRYRLDLETLKHLSVKPTSSMKPVSVKSETETVKSATQNSEICDSAIRKNRQEPLLEPSPAPTARHDQLHYACREIWDHYLAAVGRKSETYTFTPLRKQKVAARLRECLAKTCDDFEKAVALMKAAVDALAASDFHMGRDPKTGGKRYIQFESHLFGTLERLEGWLDTAQNKPRKQTGGFVQLDLAPPAANPAAAAVLQRADEEARAKINGVTAP